MAKGKPKSINIFLVATGSLVSLALAFTFWYMLVKYLSLDFSSLVNSAHSLSLIYLAVGATALFVILAAMLLHSVGFRALRRYLPFFDCSFSACTCYIYCQLWLTVYL